MTTQMTIDNSEVPSNRAQAIRDLFTLAGGSMSTREFAQICIEEGLYSTAELDQAQIRWVQNDIRRSLKRPDESGLPFAGQTAEKGKDSEPIWKQRRFWLYGDYEANIQDHLRNVEENHKAAKALARECAARFGRCPFIPGIEAA